MPGERADSIRALRSIFSGAKPKDALAPLMEGKDARDRAFLMQLVYGVLRRRLLLDWIIAKSLKSGRKPDKDTLNNLRLAVYQIFYLRTPDWAAVNEAVDMERAHKPFVNAMLRSTLRHKDALVRSIEDMRGNADSAADVALVTSHPQWLINRWSKRLGIKEAYELAEANCNIAPLTLRVNTMKATRNHILEMLKYRGIDARITHASADGIVLDDNITFGELGFMKGMVIAQDEASQLMAFALAPVKGQRILDACAAPGGKTTHIAQLMGDSGQITALEKDPVRIKMLRDNVHALGCSSVRILNQDMLRHDVKKPYDKVLLDAPCSALGTIRRNPDVLYKTSMKQIKENMLRQASMLAHASGLVKRGGSILYCTCSTEPEEGEHVVGEFLRDHSGFALMPFEGLPSGMAEGGFLRTWPHKHGMDGFFAAKIERL